MSLLVELPKWFETKPLILLRFSPGIEETLRNSRRGLSRFSFARPHGDFNDLKLPTLCLVEMCSRTTSRCFVGVATSKDAITTLESRLTVLKLQALSLDSFDALETKLTEKYFRNLIKQRLKTDSLTWGLSSKLSTAIIQTLAKDSQNQKAIEDAAFHIPKLRKASELEWEQFDAVKTAIATFGLSKNESPEFVEISEQSDSSLNYLDTNSVHALEDNVIARDASILPGFKLIEKYVTGRAVFVKGQERLQIYTANRGPLEKMFGVDLIYFNENVGNTVMVQYKMLEPNNDRDSNQNDWIFRPDKQLETEINRMKLLPIGKKVDDYRLQRNPFYFKFVRRRSGAGLQTSFIISLDHFISLRDSPKCKGGKGGVRLTYESLEGVYLRETDLIGLIRSGYIGTHRMESEALHPIISEVAKGNRALVFAWQNKIDREGES